MLKNRTFTLSGLATTLILASGSFVYVQAAHASQVTSFAETKLNITLTNNGVYTGGLQDGQTQNTEAGWPRVSNDYQYAPTPFGLEGWAWSPTTSTSIPVGNANTTVTGDVRTNFTNATPTATANIVQNGSSSSQIDQFSVPDPVRGNNYTEGLYDYFHYVYDWTLDKSNLLTGKIPVSREV